MLLPDICQLHTNESPSTRSQNSIPLPLNYYRPSHAQNRILNKTCDADRSQDHRLEINWMPRDLESSENTSVTAGP